MNDTRNNVFVRMPDRSHRHTPPSGSTEWWVQLYFFLDVHNRARMPGSAMPHRQMFNTLTRETHHPSNSGPRQARVTQPHSVTTLKRNVFLWFFSNRCVVSHRSSHRCVPLFTLHPRHLAIVCCCAYGVVKSQILTESGLGVQNQVLVSCLPSAGDWLKAFAYISGSRIGS